MARLLSAVEAHVGTLTAWDVTFALDGLARLGRHTSTVLLDGLAEQVHAGCCMLLQGGSAALSTFARASAKRQHIGTGHYSLCRRGAMRRACHQRRLRRCCGRWLRCSTARWWPSWQPWMRRSSAGPLA